MAALGLRCCTRAFSSCGERGYSLLRHAGVSLRWLLLLRSTALGARASVVVARGLSSCGSRAWLLHDMWDLPGPGLKPVSPALAGGFLTTAPPGKSQDQDILKGCYRKRNNSVTHTFRDAPLLSSNTRLPLVPFMDSAVSPSMSLLILPSSPAEMSFTFLLFFM